MTILIIEDESSFRNVLAAVLRDKGYDVRCAEDGHKAMDVLGRETVDLAVLDLMLPKMGGAEVIAKVRSDPRLAGLPMIVLTASSMPLLEQQLRPFVQAWLLKTTVSLGQVLETIRRHLPPTPVVGGVPSPLPPP